MRNRSKQRTLGNKGGVDRLKEEPHLSGAYIRSLVKQLTSSRNHRLTENTRVSNGEAACTANHVKNEELPPSVDHENKNGQFQVPAAADTSLDNLEASNLNERQDIKAKEIPGGMQKKLSTIYEATDTVQQPRRPKKQVRRRLQTSRPYQEHVLDMAEARREIVTALKYHRASMGTNSLTSKPDPVTSSKTERMKSRRTGKNYQAGTRCHACIVKPDIHRANEAKTITVCGHLLCWKCLGEWLNFCSPANDCPVCSKSLRSNDVIPISCHSSAPHSIEIPDQDSLFDVALPQGSINDIQHPKHQQEYPGPGLGLSSQEEESLKSNELDALAEHSVPLVCNPIPAWSTSETPMIAIQHPVLDPSITSQHPISLHPSQPTVDLQTHNSTILLADSRSPLSWQTALSSNSCSTPIQSSITSSILDQDCKSWHVAMDDEELAEIRSLGDQHEMEWNDTVNLVTSAWWFKFMNNPEFSDNQMLKPYQPECDSLDILAALPTESLWQDELPIDSHDWKKDINKRDCTEFGDNQSMSEPSINSENLPSAPKLFNSEEQLDDTAIQRCDCVSDPQNPASR